MHKYSILAYRTYTFYQRSRRRSGYSGNILLMLDYSFISLNTSHIIFMVFNSFGFLFKPVIKTEWRNKYHKRDQNWKAYNHADAI